MLKEKVGGKYVIAVHGYNDTQYGEADYPNFWFVSGRKYALGSNIDKIKKFNSYQEAENYISSQKPQYTKNRTFEILYLTGKWWKKDEKLHSFYPLDDESPETIDTKLIDKEITATKSHLDAYEDFLSNLSKRTIKKREAYQLEISALKKELKSLKKQRRKITIA